MSEKINGRITKEVKLRPKAEIFNLKQVFGFVPENILVIKVAGKNNWYQLMAQFTPEEQEKESRRIEENGKLLKPAKKND